MRLSSFITSKMFNFLVITIILGLSSVTVDAIRCHQCNSHLQPNCKDLNLPNATKSSEFLIDCEENKSGRMPFCRKSSVLLEFNKELRVIRSCGWINNENHKSSGCINADNEGFLQTICMCFEDGCNSAPFRVKTPSVIALILSPFIVNFIMNKMTFVRFY